MAEYIEREALEKEAVCIYAYGGARFIPLAAVQRLKAADVAPVVHGRWKITIEHKDLFDMDVWKYTCSACGEYRLSAIPLSEAIEFCPNCGARMDEGEEA